MSRRGWGLLALAGLAVVWTAVAAVRSPQVGPVPGPRPPRGLVEHGVEIDAIREAVFRYMFQNDEFGQLPGDWVYCLAIATDGYRYAHDPSDAFVARFAGHHPPVRKHSDCELVGDNLFDRSTRRRGMAVTVSDVRRTTDAAAEADGGFWVSSTALYGATYYLVKVAGHWKVVREVMRYYG